MGKIDEKMKAFYLLSAVGHVKGTWSVFIVDNCFSAL